MASVYILCCIYITTTTPLFAGSLVENENWTEILSFSSPLSLLPSCYKLCECVLIQHDDHHIMEKGKNGNEKTHSSVFFLLLLLLCCIHCTHNTQSNIAMRCGGRRTLLFPCSFWLNWTSNYFIPHRRRSVVTSHHPYTAIIALYTVWFVILYIYFFLHKCCFAERMMIVITTMEVRAAKSERMRRISQGGRTTGHKGVDLQAKYKMQCSTYAAEIENLYFILRLLLLLMFVW